MASTSSRMLALLSLLQSQRFWSGRQLQERLEVSPRTLRRDIERLRDLGYSVESIRGSTGGYRLAFGETLPPLLVDSDDATVISIGLRLVSASAIEGARETSERTLVSGARFRPRSLPAEDVAAWVSQKLIARQARYKVEVLVEAPAYLVAAQVGEWGTVEALGPEESRLIMQVDDLIWPIMILADLRADFQVVEPFELVKEMHAVGQRLISARLSRSGI